MATLWTQRDSKMYRVFVVAFSILPFLGMFFRLRELLDFTPHFSLTLSVCFHILALALCLFVWTKSQWIFLLGFLVVLNLLFIFGDMWLMGVFGTGCC